MSEDSHTIIKHSESDVNSQINLSEPFKNRLFVGVIDINKWEEDLKNFITDYEVKVIALKRTFGKE